MRQTESTRDVVLEVRDLKISFDTIEGELKAVDGVSYQIKKGQTLGLVGESGCGKTVTALAVLRLLDTPPAIIKKGEIIFQNTNILEISEKQINDIRGNSIAMVFQEPMSSLNPVLSIGFQIEELVKIHTQMRKTQCRKRSLELLSLVGIPAPDRRLREYPHQLSGGMRQRVMIAMALACDPKILIADEPTTALDVTIQAQILELLLNLREKLGMSILFITHDLGVIAEMAHRVAVMYAGKIVEEADVRTIFKEPFHPYTKGLLKSVPRIRNGTDSQRLHEIQGTVPNLSRLPKGCYFFDRCSFKESKCSDQSPELLPISEGHLVRCWLIENERHSA